MEATSHPVTACGVCVRLGHEEILRGVDMAAPQGKITGLIGPNGSGKTTLLRAMGGLVGTHAGDITILGRALHRYPRRELARTVALLAQHHEAATDMRVADVVELGMIPHQSGWAVSADRHDATARRFLQLVGAEELEDHRWSTLSGGQKQKVQLARALAQQPEVLLLDEPTNHLDPAAAWEMMETVTARRLTAVAALHDLNMAARFCHWLVVLDRGRVVAEGTPAEVLTPALLRGVYGIVADVTEHPAYPCPLIIPSGITGGGTR